VNPRRGNARIPAKIGNRAINALLKLVHETEKKARASEASERKYSFSLFSRVSKPPVEGDFLEHKSAIASFRQNLRATSIHARYAEQHHSLLHWSAVGTHQARH
jgi:hypothetical protein